MMPTNDGPQQLQQIAQQAFEQAPSLYVNGFVNGMGITDTYLVLQTNGQTTLVVNMSLSLAKTLGQSLLTQVERFEKQTGQSVLTLPELSNLTTR